MTTISDVAKRAGVSIMTVSRVINNSDHVSEKTRQRVNRAIDELSYRPNMVARGLATRHNRMIAYVVSNLANPFFAAVSTGIQSVCAANDYMMIIYDVTDARRLEECIAMLIDRRMDGVVFHHLDIDEANMKRLRENGVRCVTIDNERDLPDTTSIDSDDYEAARMATRHLIERGRRRIGCVHGRLEEGVPVGSKSPEYIESFQRRIWHNRTRGFLDEMHAHNLEPSCMVEGRGRADIMFATDTEIMRRIFAAENQTDALYCENDILALAVLGECLERGLRVPQDLAIIGHDGLDYGMVLFPRLTTACQPRMEMGILAAQKLIACIEEDAPVEHLLTHSLVVCGDTT